MANERLQAEVQEGLGSAYTIERELPRGGMSRVFVAMETALRRRVVVKVLSVPQRHLVQTRASVMTVAGQELATETESTTLRPPTGGG